MVLPARTRLGKNVSRWAVVNAAGGGSCVALLGRPSGESGSLGGATRSPILAFPLHGGKGFIWAELGRDPGRSQTSGGPHGARLAERADIAPKFVPDKSLPPVEREGKDEGTWWLSQ